VGNTTIFFGLQTKKRLFSGTAKRHSGPPNINMKYSTVEEVLASFPHPILPSVEGEPDCQTIHATRKFIQANYRAIGTHLGGGTLGHLGLIISDAAYSNIAPPTAGEPTVWETQNAPGRALSTTDGTAAQLSAACHVWEEDVQTYRTCTCVQQALKKQIIGVFEPMYL
jgi:endonuclease/exonuclease/phosphatase (EEP) superfamily protein YafD